MKLQDLQNGDRLKCFIGGYVERLLITNIKFNDRNNDNLFMEVYINNFGVWHFSRKEYNDNIDISKTILIKY